MSDNDNDGEWQVYRAKTSKHCPHLITAKQAHRLEKELNITGLANAFLRSETKQLQYDGWCYDKVLKFGPKDEIEEYTERPQYITVPINNKWNDYILFCKKIL